MALPRRARAADAPSQTLNGPPAGVGRLGNYLAWLEPTLRAASTILRSPGQKRGHKWTPNLTPQAGPYKAQSIGFAPWFPLAGGDLAKPGTLLDGIAKSHRASPGQVALAWLPRRSPVMLPIPGTARVRHLEQNIVAAVIFKRGLRGA